MSLRNRSTIHDVEIAERTSTGTIGPPWFLSTAKSPRAQPMEPTSRIFETSAHRIRVNHSQHHSNFYDNSRILCVNSLRSHQPNEDKQQRSW